MFPDSNVYRIIFTTIIKSYTYRREDLELYKSAKTIMSDGNSYCYKIFCLGLMDSSIHPQYLNRFRANEWRNSKCSAHCRWRYGSANAIWLKLHSLWVIFWTVINLLIDIFVRCNWWIIYIDSNPLPGVIHLCIQWLLCIQAMFSLKWYWLDWKMLLFNWFAVKNVKLLGSWLKFKKLISSILTLFRICKRMQSLVLWYLIYENYFKAFYIRFRRPLITTKVGYTHLKCKKKYFSPLKLWPNANVPVPYICGLVCAHIQLPKYLCFMCFHLYSTYIL